MNYTKNDLPHYEDKYQEKLNVLILVLLNELDALHRLTPTTILATIDYWWVKNIGKIKQIIGEHINALYDVANKVIDIQTNANIDRLIVADLAMFKTVIEKIEQKYNIIAIQQDNYAIPTSLGS